ncbi:MAG: outer membrane lipid asymmetry maintenance protein MlaD [Rhodospirillaceae bacterium]|nr:outer membrane lipid asymmetry maintenance protein MlaD [Rhodospirillaceae bacterium]
MKRNPLETLLGAVVLVVAAMFLLFAYSIADLKAVTGYEVKATFLKVGGLERGSDVRISGIDVGTVTGQALNPETFQALVTMSIEPNVVLPVDTQATIVSDGLLGGKYVNLVPGRAQEHIVAGGVIAKTQDFQSLEDLVGQIIFLATNTDTKSGAVPAPASAAPQ